MTLSTKHLLGIKDLTPNDISLILQTAEQFKEVLQRPIKKVPSLRDVTIVNLFYESSTRTRISFELAEKRLTADTINFTASGSSVSKGETLLDAFSIKEKVGRLEGTKVAIIGDILHSRVAQSNIYLLKKMGAEVIVCGPPTLIPKYMEEAFDVKVEYNLKKAVEWCD